MHTQRNIRNELAVALLVCFVALIVLGSIIVISTVVGDVPPTSVAQVASATATAPARTTVPAPTLSPTSAVQLASPTATAFPGITAPMLDLSPTAPTATARVTHTATATRTATSTPVPPTLTLTSTASPAQPTQRSIGRATATPLVQATPIARFPLRLTPARATPDPTAIPLSLRLTATAIVATVSTFHDGLFVSQPSRTPTAQSVVALPPSAQPIPTETMMDGNESLGILPTLPPTPTVVPAAATQRPAATCNRPAGWATYTVQAGNTLFAIALAVGETLDELRYVNCLEDVDNITAGDEIFVPRLPAQPIATTVPSGLRFGLLQPIGCDDPSVQITSPDQLQRLSGVITMRGSATRDDFWYYKIEIRPDWAAIYNFYLDSEVPIANGVLGEINTAIFDKGVHWLRLSVVDERATIPDGATCEIPVIFE